MNETLSLVLAGGVGILLGAFFFVGLWWTIRKGVSSNNPALWFIGSSLLRVSVVLAGLFFVSSGHWDRLLVCLLGFVIARLIIMWLTRTPKRPPYQTEKAGHAF
jgi:F1F0 ATPase subunit 2